MDPFSLPPGPERRELMYEQGYNITPHDFTDEENAEIDREMVEIRAAFDRADAERAAQSSSSD